MRFDIAAQLMPTVTVTTHSSIWTYRAAKRLITNGSGDLPC